MQPLNVSRDETVIPAPARHRIAVLVPCYNEAAAIGQVVSDFRAALPEATPKAFIAIEAAHADRHGVYQGAMVKAMTWHQTRAAD